MPLPRAISRIPESIADLSVVLTDYVADGEEPARQEGRFEVQVVYDNGEVKLIQGDLVPHLTPHLTQGQVDQLIAFMDMLRAKAESEILP